MLNEKAFKIEIPSNYILFNNTPPIYYPHTSYITHIIQINIIFLYIDLFFFYFLRNSYIFVADYQNL